VLATSPAQELALTDVVFAPDGKTLASSSGDWQQWQTPGEIKLWSAPELKELRTLGRHDEEIKGVAFLPGGSRLVSWSSSSRGTTRLWELATGKEVGRFAGCHALALLPDGRRVATGDMKGKLTLWDLEKQEPLLKFEGHKDLMYALASTPTGRYWRAPAATDRCVCGRPRPPEAEARRLQSGFAAGRPVPDASSRGCFPLVGRISNPSVWARRIEIVLRSEDCRNLHQGGIARSLSHAAPGLIGLHRLLERRLQFVGRWPGEIAHGGHEAAHLLPQLGWRLGRRLTRSPQLDVDFRVLRERSPEEASQPGTDVRVHIANLLND
jgi:hypothetical protein